MNIDPLILESGLIFQPRSRKYCPATAKKVSLLGQAILEVWLNEIDNGFDRYVILNDEFRDFFQKRGAI